MKKIFLKNNQGFTIIEMLVATTLFLIVISITTSIFMINIRTQRYLLASVNASEEISYALEMMGREIRMGTNFSAIPEDTLQFTNNKGQVIVYRFNSYGDIAASDYESWIERSIGGQNYQKLTSPDLRVLNLKFLVQGNQPEDQQQTRVTIMLKIASYAGKQELETNLQTTVSSRQLED